MNNYIKNIATVFGGNALGQVIPLLMGPILTHIFLPEEFGIYETYLVVGGLFAVISTLRFDLSIMLPESDEEALKIVRLNLRIAAVISIVALIFCYLFRFRIAELTEESKIIDFIWAVPFFVFFTGLYQSFHNYHSRIKNYKTVSTSRIVQSAGVNTFNLGINLLKSGAFSLILGHLLGLFASLITLFKREFIKGQFVKFKDQFKNYSDFPLINAPHAFTDQLLQRFGIIFLLLEFYGLEVVAFFALSNKYLKGPLRLISTSVSSVFFQQATEDVKKEGSPYKTAMTTSLLSLAIGLPLLIILSLYGEDLFGIVFGENWKRAGIISSIMVWSLFTNFLSSPISTLPITMNKQKQAFIYSTIGQTIPLLVTYGYMKGEILKGFNWFSGQDDLNAILIYSALSSVYFLLIWLWYLKLAKNK